LTRLPVLLVIAALLTLFVAACGDDSDDSETPTPAPTSTAPAASPSPAATATSAPEATATTAAPTATTGTGGGVGAPAAPSDATLTGELPDLNTPVPPGQGEAGRLTVHWTDNSDNETGFRIYNDCNGTVSALLDVPANEEQYGPLQSCRPGRVGVAAFNDIGESDVVWAVPGS
jgi:hypothetical protein